MLKPDRSLPNEILVHIFSRLSQRNLTNVVLVSHRFNAIAERVLYSSIDIDEAVTEDSKVLKRTLGWCDAMKRNQLYDIPRKLSIRWRICKVGLEKSEALSHSCSLVSNNIRHLTFLDTLELSVDPMETPTPATVELLIRNLHLPNLRHCLLDAGDPDWPGQYDMYTPTSSRNMCRFIASLSGLRSLAVLVSESAVELVPHDALPELSIFYGTPGGAAFILPGRPVHHLRLTGMEFDLNSENLSRMALTSVPLRILDLSTVYVSPSALRDIATHLPTIEILSVFINLSWTGSIGNLSCLALFNKLNWLDLSPVWKKDDERRFCYEWHSVCPSLRHIRFPFHNHHSAMWAWNEDGYWTPCDPPNKGSADGLYRYTRVPWYLEDS